MKKIEQKDKKDIQPADSKSNRKPAVIRPRITEKASLQSNANAYTFVVDRNATKLSIVAEMKAKHGVTPVKVNIVNLPSKTVNIRGKVGTKAGIKKAIVFLKKGDTIKLA